MTLLDEVTEEDVLGRWNAGVKTVADLRATGSAGRDARCFERGFQGVYTSPSSLKSPPFTQSHAMQWWLAQS